MTQIKNHFNALIEDCDDLGDILFGDLDDFKTKVERLNDDEIQSYTEELVNQEVVVFDDDDWEDMEKIRLLAKNPIR